MAVQSSFSAKLLLVACLFGSVANAFVTTTSSPKVTFTRTPGSSTTTTASTNLPMMSSTFDFEPFSTMEVAGSTIDPTTMLAQGLAGLLNSPAILLVPILAALGVASLIAWLIVAYASPQVEDDE